MTCLYSSSNTLRPMDTPVPTVTNRESGLTANEKLPICWMETFFRSASCIEGGADTANTLKNESPHVTIAAALAVQCIATTEVPTGC